MTRLLLVRHAESVPPTPGGPGELDRPLSTRGVEQARALVDELAGHAPRRVPSSPYARAVATVRPTADRLGLPVGLRQDLREWHSGLAPTPRWAQPYRHAWAHPDQALPGGESLARLAERVGGALGAVAAETADEGCVVVSSHGTWIAVALRTLGHPVDEALWLGMPSPAVYEVTATDGGTTVRGPGLLSR